MPAIMYRITTEICSQDTKRFWIPIAAGTPGALELANMISKELKAPLFSCNHSRLLIEPNRSETHPSLFSEFSRGLPAKDKDTLKNTLYRPYRESIYNHIRKVTSGKKRILHISVHTFTPELDGKKREFDIGLLYDPSRYSEKEFCSAFKKSLKLVNNSLTVRMNKPYLGKSDGLTTWLRKKFESELYTGIELEVNQALFFNTGSEWEDTCRTICQALI